MVDRIPKMLDDIFKDIGMVDSLQIKQVITAMIYLL
jgi:hypothetical protein